MIRPGDRLAVVAALLCGATTMERVIRPLIADLQSEYAEAIRNNRAWQGRWIRMTGFVALLKVITLCGCARTMRRVCARAVDDHSALGRTAAFSLVATTVVGASLLFNADRYTKGFGGTLTSRPGLVFYLIPSALPLAVPMGFALGVLSGLRHQVLSRRSARSVLSMAAACSVVSFVFLAWVVPASNDAFREAAYGSAARLSRGVNEMSLRELSRQITSDREAGVSNSAILPVVYHARWALSCGTLLLALFALSVLGRSHVTRWGIGFLASGAYIGYYLNLFDGQLSLLRDILPAFAVAWLPNALVVILAVALLKVASEPASVCSPD